MLVVPSQLCQTFDVNIKEMRWLKKENRLVDHKKHKSIRIENSKQYALKIENIWENKWKTNEKQIGQFVTELLKISWMKRDLHREKPSEKSALKH